MFTDGVSEAMDETEVEFGEERLIEVVQENGNIAAKRMSSLILERVQEHVGSAPAHDDLTLIVARGS